MIDSSSPAEPLFGTLAIAGVGLIGGSIAAAARRNNVAGQIIGIGRTASRLEAAVDAGLIDTVTTDPAVAAEADLAIVCTPVDRIVKDVRILASVLGPGSLITDAGSTKDSVCKALTDLDGANGPAFIGSHPLAGSELQGFEHARADLFHGRLCVITPTENARPDHTAQLEQFWHALGANVVSRTPELHDQALARTSHLPHLVAAAMAGSLQDSDAQFTASGFRDTTRIAAGDPGLWVPIFSHNTTAILAALDRLQAKLKEFSDSLQHHDTCALQKLLEEAKRNRDGLG